MCIRDRNKDMHEAHDAYLCIGEKTYVNVKDRKKYSSEHYLKKSDDMCKLFNDIPEALENNFNFPLRISYRPKSSSPVLPNIQTDKIKDVDLVIEAVAENLEIKHTVYKNITPHLKESVIMSSNTSGIPLAELIKVLPDNLKSRFLITHFFNPPRYMRLLELVKGPQTDKDIYNTLASIGENILGKGIVHAKDTPNFIGNRIGVHGANNACLLYTSDAADE